MVRLGDVCEVVSGSTPKSAVREYWGGFVKWVTPAELSEDDYYVHDTERHLSELGVKSANLHMMPVGTVLLSSRAPIGKVAITAAEMTCNQGFKNLICSSDLHNRYLYYFLKKNKTYLNSLGRGATFKEISKEIVADIKLPLPPLKVQNHMADILDKITFIIDLRKQQLNKLDLLIKSQFIEMFGDPVTNPMGWDTPELGSISTSRLGKMLDAKQQTGENRFPYLANFNVQWFHFDLSDLNEMDFDKAAQQEFLLQDGDLMVCEGGEIGRCAIWRNEKTPCFYQKAVHRIRCDRSVLLPEYLAFWFYIFSQSHGFDDMVGNKTTIAHLPGVKLKKLGVILPPLELQNRFAAFVESTDKSKVAIRQSLKKLELAYHALMQEYFG